MDFLHQSLLFICIEIKCHSPLTIFHVSIFLIPFKKISEMEDYRKFSILKQIIIKWQDQHSFRI